MWGEAIKRRAGAGFREVGRKGERGEDLEEGVGSGGAFLGLGEGEFNGGDRGGGFLPFLLRPGGGGDRAGGGGWRWRRRSGWLHLHGGSRARRGDRWEGLVRLATPVFFSFGCWRLKQQMR